MRLRTVRKIGRLISQCVIFQPKVRLFTDIEFLMILLTSHAGFLASHEPVGDLGKRRKIVNIYLFQIIVHISGSGARWATKNWMVNTFIKTGLLSTKAAAGPGPRMIHFKYSPPLSTGASVPAPRFCADRELLPGFCPV